MELKLSKFQETCEKYSSPWFGQFCNHPKLFNLSLSQHKWRVHPIDAYKLSTPCVPILMIRSATNYF